MTEEEWEDFGEYVDRASKGGLAAADPRILTLLAAYLELKERREDEEWLWNHDWKYLRAIRGELKYGGGFTIFDSRTKENVTFHDTIHAAIEAAKSAKKAGKEGV